jgi:hypothetical protein
MQDLLQETDLPGILGRTVHGTDINQALQTASLLIQVNPLSHCLREPLFSKLNNQQDMLFPNNTF